MSTKGKLLVTPAAAADTVEKFIGEALKFRLPPCAPHLTVVELGKLPTAAVFPSAETATARPRSMTPSASDPSISG